MQCRQWRTKCQWTDQWNNKTHCSTHTHRYPYAAVAEMVYGKRMRFVVTFLLNLTVFGAGIPNILVCELRCPFPNATKIKICILFQHHRTCSWLDFVSVTETFISHFAIGWSYWALCSVQSCGLGARKIWSRWIWITMRRRWHSNHFWYLISIRQTHLQHFSCDSIGCFVSDLGVHIARWIDDATTTFPGNQAGWTELSESAASLWHDNVSIWYPSDADDHRSGHDSET